VVTSEVTILQENHYETNAKKEQIEHLNGRNLMTTLNQKDIITLKKEQPLKSGEEIYEDDGLDYEDLYYDDASYDGVEIDYTVQY
tara:strand:+ start:15500 stop:15754 length:255 start_codon:yes stop_codon:yes gene_type:complete